MTDHAQGDVGQVGQGDGFGGPGRATQAQGGDQAEPG